MTPSTYRAVLLKGRGGLDQLELVERPLLPPGRGELRLRVRASGVGFTDITKRTGRYPFAPPFPFVDGYEVVGDVDAIGDGVSGFAIGDRVCALTVYGGWAESFTRDAGEFVRVPPAVDDGDVVALILNYATAYQMIERVARVQPGQTALVTGANGGVGTALLELLRLRGVRAIGAASRSSWPLVESLGGEPIESRTTPLDVATRAVVPAGVDVAFDGHRGAGTAQCIRALRPGGLVVGYGFMASNGAFGAMRGFASLFVGARLAGRRGTFYGITARYRKNREPYKEDLATLLRLLADKKIRPRIAVRLPLLAGREGERLLEAGGIAGKIVLLRD
jgi:NADPH:quinone reductase-like Zn-dependent oxidoreductase